MTLLLRIVKSFYAGVLAVSFLLGVALCAKAASPQEMDHARAIAAKFYLRYINNGSDYLDNLKPTSMADLESRLKKTEKDNIKAFKAAIPTSDYASWNQDKLAEYWSSTFFKDASGLDDKSKNNSWIRGKVSAAIKSEVKVSPQVSVHPEQPQETAAPEAIAEEAAEETFIVEEPAVAIQEESTASESKPAEQPKPNSGTWVYVMILCILVAVVIALVVYASKTMKGQPQSRRREDEEDNGIQTYAPMNVESPRSAVAEETRIREKFAETLAAKSEEIRILNRKLADMEAENEGLRTEVRKLQNEAERLRKAAYAPRETAETVPAASSGASSARPREIYLGRANAKGLFVRADRHAVEGQSMFKLRTADGLSGTFTLIDHPAIDALALNDPGKWIAGGCFAKDIFDTEGRRRIVTETPGVAVFQDGAWRVERKAKIRYE